MINTNMDVCFQLAYIGVHLVQLYHSQHWHLHDAYDALAFTVQLINNKASLQHDVLVFHSHSHDEMAHLIHGRLIGSSAYIRLSEDMSIPDSVAVLP